MSMEWFDSPVHAQRDPVFAFKEFGPTSYVCTVSIAAVAVTDYLIGASFSVSLSCLRAPARMFRSE